MRQAAKVYFETQVTTRSQGEILIMLYDGAINFLTRAKDLMDAKDYAGKGKLISSAIDILDELSSTLNVEKGGDLATNLSRLYFYCSKRLFLANSRMDKTIIDEVIKILGGIRSAYAQIMETPEAQAALASMKAPNPMAARTPAGTASAPAGQVPVNKSRVQNAYAAQAGPRADSGTGLSATPAQAADAAPDPSAHGVVSEKAAPETAHAAPHNDADQEPCLPEAVAVASAPAPAMPDLDMADAATPPPGFANKRLAASNLYRKFTS